MKAGPKSEQALELRALVEPEAMLDRCVLQEEEGYGRDGGRLGGPGLRHIR